MATVIVPAHNEASVIRRCLNSLINQPDLDTLIVACNGCTDDTAEIVRNEYPQAICHNSADFLHHGYQCWRQHLQSWHPVKTAADCR